MNHETKVYKYDELSDGAKAKARGWYRDASAGDNLFAEYLTDDLHVTLNALGFYVDERDVSWSGFWSQGDGASFKGTWYASDCKPDALRADRPATWTTNNAGVIETHESKENAELHRIIDALLACKASGLVSASIDTGRGFFMSLDSAEHDQHDDMSDAETDEYTARCVDTEETFIEAARDLAHAFYVGLRTEYEYQNADEQVAESLIANEYEFTEEGERA